MANSNFNKFKILTYNYQILKIININNLKYCFQFILIKKKIISNPSLQNIHENLNFFN